MLIDGPEDYGESFRTLVAAHADSNIMPWKTYDSESDDDQYSYGMDDFKMQIDALGASEARRVLVWNLRLDFGLWFNFADSSPTRPLAKNLDQRLSLLLETTPIAPRVAKRELTTLSQDEEMEEINEGTLSNLLKRYVIHACAVGKCMLSQR